MFGQISKAPVTGSIRYDSQDISVEIKSVDHDAIGFEVKKVHFRELGFKLGNFLCVHFSDDIEFVRINWIREDNTGFFIEAKPSERPEKRQLNNPTIVRHMTIRRV